MPVEKIVYRDVEKVVEKEVCGREMQGRDGNSCAHTLVADTAYSFNCYGQYQTRLALLLVPPEDKERQRLEWQEEQQLQTLGNQQRERAAETRVALHVQARVYNYEREWQEEQLLQTLGNQQQLIEQQQMHLQQEKTAKIWGRTRALLGGCTVESAGAVGGGAEGALAWCRWLDAPSRTGRRLRHSLRSPAGLVSRRDPATSTGRCFAFWSRVAVV